jgi:tetratricopeptide (TPR) repeat protein
MKQEAQKKDFFISYNKADRVWAEWIAWQLEAAGHTTILQAWDFRPSENFVLNMQKATEDSERTIAVLSPDYLKSLYTQPEWAAAFRLDPTSKNHKLLPVRVRRCKPGGLLGSIVYIDLVGRDRETARKLLLEGVNPERARPDQEPPFPGKATPKGPAKKEPEPPFPGLAAPAPWNVPSGRNPFFTGQEHILSELYRRLHSGQNMALTQPQAISGLGGIGKTQIAIEYAHRHREEYEAVLWANADSRETLEQSYGALASLLQLPESSEQDQSRVIAAVKRWLATNAGWLLILDNADDIAIVREFLPTEHKGHVLLTTRAQALADIAQALSVAPMRVEEGALLLLHRARRLDLAAPLDVADVGEHNAAATLAQEFDGLPLALDQAGAYCEETGCSITGYLERYRAQHAQLLNRRGRLAKEHPQSVAATFALAFEKVRERDEGAADLLRLCAFLHPDAIPEELFLEAAPELGPRLRQLASDPITLYEAIGTLRAYSLVRGGTGTRQFAMHRLVQAVLRDSMSTKEQRQWAMRAVRAIAHAFPDPRDMNNWPRCQRYIVQVQNCANLVKDWNMAFEGAAWLLNAAGYYLDERALYDEAEKLYRASLTLRERIHGSDHPYVATALNNLALLYDTQARYAEAESLYQRSLAIRERALGPGHPLVAATLNNLAALYNDQARYAEAESLYQRALAINEHALKPDHSDVATSLNNLAILYVDQEKYEQAEPLMLRALAIYERAYGAMHPAVATTLSNLAELYSRQGHYEQAEPLYQRSLAIREQIPGPDHPDTAYALNNLAGLLYRQERYSEAESLDRRALAIREHALGPNHPLVAASLHSVAMALRAQGREKEARALDERARAIEARNAAGEGEDNGLEGPRPAT